MATPRDDAVEEVRARTDLVELVSEHVRLRRVGRSYVGLCPFHPENTPSFHVSPDRQLFYCFGCQAGGDAFRFVMLKLGLSFPEALRLLADRAGVRLPEREETPAQRRARAERERLLEALEWAARFYQHRLRASADGREALAYLERRGVDAATAERFRLGWAPADGAALVEAMRRQGFEPEVLLRAGLAGARERPGGRPGPLYDWLRGRIAFPIADERGRVIGFGGRALGEGEPKYLNSPETPLFRKRHVWYALDRARAAIRRDGRVLVVEGYMDAIACHRAGIDWAVASLGTALSEEQARALARLAGEIVIAYDADAAGQAATVRGIDHLRRLAPEAAVRVAPLPEGEDPDSFLSRHGREAFLALLEGAQDYLDYRFERAAAVHGLGDVAARVRVARELAPLLAGLADPVARDAYVRRFADRLQISPAALAAEVARRRHKTPPGRTDNKDELASGPAPPAEDPYRRAERELVRLLVARPARLAHVRQEGLAPSELEDPGCAEVLAALLEEGPPAGEDEPDRIRWLHRVYDRVPGDRGRALLAALGVEAAPPDDPEGAVARALVARIRRRPLARRYEALYQQVREYERKRLEVPAELLRTLQDLARQLRGA